MLFLTILTLHIVALATFGGAMLLTQLRRLDMALRSYSAENVSEGLRGIRRAGFSLAVLTGVALFVPHAGQLSRNPWFWAKITLLLLIALTAWIFRQSPKPAAALSLLLWTAVICVSRGPATVKDVMHSMIDPSGDFIFESVRIIGDVRGSREEGPKTDAQWGELRRLLAILSQAPELLDDRRAARLRDRSRNPSSESQPEEIQAAMEADRAGFTRRARLLSEAAAAATKAADAKDTKALVTAIDGIDKACERCHLHYWYPNDKRAQEAARESGLTDF